MANALLIFVVYGPIIVSLVCWFVLAMEDSRSRKSEVVRVLSPERQGREERSWRP